MPSDPPFDDEPLDPVTEEALARLVHLQSGDATAQDRADHDAWKAADPEHAAAGARAERLWTMLGPALASRKVKGPKRIPVVLAAGAALAALAVASGLFGPPAAYVADERTGVGERRGVTLADGSKVELDTGTSFDVTEGGRRLTLYTGQVFVTVARDPTRPFRVVSGDATVEALGTAFDVRRDGETTTVVVTESAVRVSHPDRAGGLPVAAGQEVAFSPTTGRGPVRRAALPERTAWRQGQLRFTERPLGEVLDELGRYRRGVIIVTDPALRRLPVTGVFDVDRPDVLLDAVAVALPVRVRRLPWLTIVRRDPERPLDPAGRR